DHTDLRANAKEADIVRLCEEARAYGFHAAVIAPTYVPLAAAELSNSDVRVCSVVSFPLGHQSAEIKAAEAKVILGGGADEIDMVMNIAAFLCKRLQIVEEEIRMVAARCRERDAILKVIIETAYLDSDGIRLATEIVAKCGADFVKTSTGFAPAGATIEAVRCMRAVAGNHLRIKAAGGIRTGEFARKLIEAGASRIGCSASIDVVSLPDCGE
ncbi:MAG: deoxyribose-phosphate aldolase, partial [Candidatus Latescibacterota bacterium]